MTSAFPGQAEKASVPVEFPQDGVWDVHTPAQRHRALPGEDNRAPRGCLVLSPLDTPCLLSDTAVPPVTDVPLGQGHRAERV